MTALRPHSLAARLLSVTCAAPCTRDELRDRVKRRTGQTVRSDHARNELPRLARLGFVRNLNPPGGKPGEYVLTPEGERELDRLHFEAELAAVDL